MKGQNYADVVRRLVRQAHEERTAERTAGPPPDPARLVSAVEQALRARGHRRIVARRAGAAAAVTFAAAAAFALVVGLRAHRADELVASTPASARRALTLLGSVDEAGGGVLAGANPSVALRSGMAIAAGLTLRAPATGEVRIGTTDGTSLALEGGELAVTEAGATQRFTLRAGTVNARVSRLFAGERFIIDTKDAEIEVHGTSFRVAVVPSVPSCGGGTTTRVSVLEGVVRVLAGNRETNVFPGGVWPEGCEPPAARTERLVVEHARVHVAHAHAQTPAGEAPPLEPPAAAAPAPVATPAPASSLAAENDLFERAVRAKKEGHLDEASRLFEVLVFAHPASPLVESAMAQRMKILAAVDPVASQRAAEAYLARFPTGFARPEAQRLSLPPSP